MMAARYPRALFGIHRLVIPALSDPIVSGEMFKGAVVGLGDYGARVAATLTSATTLAGHESPTERDWSSTRTVIRELLDSKTVGGIGDVQLDFVALTTSMLYQVFDGDATTMSRQLHNRVRALAESDSSIKDWFPFDYPYVGSHPSGFWQHTSPAIMRGMLLGYRAEFQERLSALDDETDQICLISTSFGRAGSAWIHDVVRMCNETRPKASVRVLLLVPNRSGRHGFLGAIKYAYLRTSYALREIAITGVPDSEIFLYEIENPYRTSFRDFNSLASSVITGVASQLENDEVANLLDLRRSLLELAKSEWNEVKSSPLVDQVYLGYRIMEAAAYHA